MLMKAITVDAQAVQRHRATILECVKVLQVMINLESYTHKTHSDRPLSLCLHNYMHAYHKAAEVFSLKFTLLFILISVGLGEKKFVAPGITF